MTVRSAGGTGGRVPVSRLGAWMRGYAREERAARRGLQLAGQVGHHLHELGESHPVPVLGGFVAEDEPAGRVRVYWRLPGPSLFAGHRRHRNLRRYARLLRAWGLATDLRLDAPEPYLACWFACRRSG